MPGGSARGRHSASAWRFRAYARAKCRRLPVVNRATRALLCVSRGVTGAEHYRPTTRETHRMAQALRAAETRDDGNAGVDDVRDFAESLPQRFLYCREMGHNWRPSEAGRFKDGGFHRTLLCSRCRTRRKQSIDSRGLILSSQYEYADGYQAPGGMGRITGDGRGALRLASILRVAEKNDRKGA